MGRYSACEGGRGEEGGGGEEEEEEEEEEYAGRKEHHGVFARLRSLRKITEIAEKT